MRELHIYIRSYLCGSARAASGGGETPIIGILVKEVQDLKAENKRILERLNKLENP